MAFCTNCGAELKEGKFCTNCGAPTEPQTEENTYTYTENTTNTPPAAEPPKKMGLNVGMLVWSIINTVLCCQVLGIIALVMTILASESTDVENAAKNLKVARVLNIIGAVCAALYVVFIIAYVIIAILFGGFMSMSVLSAMSMV